MAIQLGQAQITVLLDFLLSSGTQGRAQPTNALILPVEGIKWMRNTQKVGIIEEDLYLGDVSPLALGLCWAINRGGPTTWVDLRADAGGANLVRFRPGVPCLLPGFTPNARPKLIANVDYVDLEYILMET